MTGAGDRPVVAIDGPSGVGKSTVARLVADHLAVPYLDTGAMYRCVGLAALRSGELEPEDDALQQLLDDLHLDLSVDGEGTARLLLDGRPVGEEIRTAEVAEATSRLAARPRVRDAMVERQRAFGASHGGVLEGRDIGTVVFPDTPFKFFLDADPGVRAERRWRQMVERDPSVRLEDVREDLARRDRRDRERESSPLRRTPSHLLVDTGTADAAGVARRIAGFVAASAG